MICVLETAAPSAYSARMRYMIPFLLLSATQVAGFETCDELWFARNHTYASYGHCFASPLGKVYFANPQCTSDPADLEEPHDGLVARIRAREVELGCDIDTKQTRLNIVAADWRDYLTEQPVAADYESGCLGYLGPYPIALNAGPATYTTTIATIALGATIIWGFEPTQGWDFVVAEQPDGSTIAGWTNETVDKCETFAG